MLVEWFWDWESVQGSGQLWDPYILFFVRSKLLCMGVLHAQFVPVWPILSGVANSKAVSCCSDWSVSISSTGCAFMIGSLVVCWPAMGAQPLGQEPVLLQWVTSSVQDLGYHYFSEPRTVARAVLAREEIGHNRSCLAQGSWTVLCESPRRRGISTV